MNIPGSKVFLGKKINDPIGSTIELDPSLREDTSEPMPPPEVRGPSSNLADSLVDDPTVNDQGYWGPRSINIFSSMRALEIGLKTNDNSVVQNSIEFLDDGISQINLSRS